MGEAVNSRLGRSGVNASGRPNTTAAKGAGKYSTPTRGRANVSGRWVVLGRVKATLMVAHLLYNLSVISFLFPLNDLGQLVDHYYHCIWSCPSLQLMSPLQVTHLLLLPLA